MKNYAITLVLILLFLSNTEISGFTQSDSILVNQQALETQIQYAEGLYEKGNLEDARIYLEEKINLHLDHEHYSDHGRIQMSLLLSSVYIDLRELEHAENLLLLLRDLCSRTDCPYFVKIYNNLGNLYSIRMRSFREPDLGKTAMGYYIDALKSLNSSDKLLKAKLNHNIGMIHRFVLELDSAEYYLITALRSFEELGISSSIANTLENIGINYEFKREFHQAESFYLRALSLNKKARGEKNIYVAQNYMNLGLLYLATDSLDQSLLFLQKAIYTLSNESPKESYDRNPSVKSITNLSRALTILEFKIDVLTSLNTNSTHQLNKVILQSSKYADSILLQLSFESDFPKRKKNLIKKFYAIFKDGVKASYDLTTHNYSENVDDLFEMMEYAKQRVLNERLKSSFIRRGNIEKADATVKDWFRTKSRIDQIYSSMLNSKSVGQLNALRDSLLRVELRYNQLISQVKKKYPNIFNLFSASTVIGLDTLKKKLQHDQLLLEYFQSDTSVYLLAISKDKTKAYSINYDTLLSSHIEKLSELFRQGQALNTQKFRDEYVELASEVYQKIVSPVFNDFNKSDFKQLIIIPDGQLSYLPFELLLPSNEKAYYTELDYLINDFAIQYSYSVTFLYNNFLGDKDRASRNLLAMAPHYPVRTGSMPQEPEKRIRSNLSPLKWNKNEAENIASQLKGLAITGQGAQEGTFKEGASKYKVLHLAMHALVDDEDPMNSKLAFSPSIDSLEDGFLHAFEIFDMHLNADLVVLSACNSNYGTLQNGEGIASLGRAFMYAGVPSLLATHWKVDDKVSLKIMNRVYQNLKSGMRKSEALRQAKLDFIRSGNPINSNPFYWASFVLVGNDKPVLLKEKKDNLLWTLIIGFLIIVITSFLYIKNIRV